MHTNAILNESMAGCRSAAWQRILASSVLALIATQSTATLAQDSALIDEVIVTARKRAETIQDAPVAVSVLSEEGIRSFGVTDLVSASKLTPGLLLSRSTNNAGANIYLRGVGSSFVSVSFDQAVAVNIDNVPISKGRAITQSFFDMQQVEVLRGPQALFFGKNSTAGVVSVQTANPGDALELMGRGGYEIEGSRYYGDAIASGPIGDNWGARLSIHGSTMNGGFFENNSAQLTGVPRDRDTPQEDEFGGRLTVTYRPNERFDVNAKFSADTLESDGPNGYSQLINCQGPGGSPQPNAGVPNLADCSLNRIQSTPALAPTIAAGFPRSNGGQPYLDYDGLLGSVTANYRWNNLTLTSVTGYYDFSTAMFDNYNLGSASQTFGYERTDYTSLTQELRVASEFEGLLNFTAGVFYDDTSLDYGRAVRLRTHAADPATGRTDSWDTGGSTDGDTFSAFAELIAAITPQLELSGGARYSRETKDTVLNVFYANPSAGFAFIAAPVTDRFDDDNVSPSATLRWRPTDKITLFASYKEGYKSGGTNLSEIPFRGVTSRSVHFESETAHGGEVGAKAQLLDDSLWLGVTVYRYRFEDLQFSIFDPVTLTRHLGNAGAYDTTGVELDAQYESSMVKGLKLWGSAYYNEARYVEFLGACYTGQTIAAGCNQAPHPTTGVFTSQDLEGKPGAHAPDWTATLGTSFDFPLGGGTMAGLNVQARYTSEFYLQETLAPTQLQDDYVDLSASLRLYDADRERWEVALIGRNLTDKLVGANAIDNPGTGSGTGTAVGRLADTYMILNRPREVALQFTLRY